ncbi:hypothetical protein OAD18_10765 [Oceanospirillaceae bacterium]|jgi:hypothetical protein|nr:hypothetical protein [Oceanospirillaceae bacterium]
MRIILINKYGEFAQKTATSNLFFNKNFTQKRVLFCILTLTPIEAGLQMQASTFANLGQATTRP